jgi:hypothetical protein
MGGFVKAFETRRPNISVRQGEQRTTRSPKREGGDVMNMSATAVLVPAVSIAKGQ